MSVNLSNLLISESEDGDSWYYTTPTQLDELMDALDPVEFESALCREINDFREEIVRQMELTEKITNQYKGNKKSFLDIENSWVDYIYVIMKYNDLSTLSNVDVNIKYIYLKKRSPSYCTQEVGVDSMPTTNCRMDLFAFLLICRKRKWVG